MLTILWSRIVIVIVAWNRYVCSHMSIQIWSLLKLADHHHHHIWYVQYRHASYHGTYSPPDAVTNRHKARKNKGSALHQKNTRAGRRTHAVARSIIVCKAQIRVDRFFREMEHIFVVTFVISVCQIWLVEHNKQTSLFQIVQYVYSSNVHAINRASGVGPDVGIYSVT